jgi:hypothetical protein
MDGLIWKAIRTLGVALLLAWPAAGYADEVLKYDKSLYAPLENALASDKAIIAEEDRAKQMHVTRYVVDGQSADEWNESLEVVETHLKDQPKTLDDWYAEFTSHFDPVCTAKWHTIEKKHDSMIFERHVQECPIHAARHTMFRVLYGRQHVYIMIAEKRPDMEEEARQGWLAVLRTAKLTG